MVKLSPRFLSTDDNKISIDYHVHSDYNDDAKGTVEEYVKAALRKRLTSIAISNHVWRTSSWIDDFVDDVKRVRLRIGFHLLVGFEAKAINLNGEIDLAAQYIKKGELILGALHRFPTKDDYLWLGKEHLSPSKAAETIRDATLNMISRGEVNVVAHPLALYYINYKDVFPDGFLEEIVQAASKKRIAIEIYNSKYPLPDSIYNKLVRWCAQYSAPISVGSDAHDPSEIGRLDYRRIRRAIKQVSGSCKKGALGKDEY